MSQILKLKRGSLERLSSITGSLQKGEVIFASGSSNITADNGSSIAFVTIGATFLTYVLNAYALKHASSSLVGSYIYLQPVLATLIAIISGKDFLSLDKFLSMLIVFSGVFLASFKKTEKS